MNKYIRRDITSIKYAQKELNNLRNFKRNKYEIQQTAKTLLFPCSTPIHRQIQRPNGIRHRVNIIYIYIYTHTRFVRKKMKLDHITIRRGKEMEEKMGEDIRSKSSKKEK